MNQQAESITLIPNPNDLQSNYECVSCGQMGHSRKSSHLCPLNSKNLHLQNNVQNETQQTIPSCSLLPVTCLCGSNSHKNNRSIFCPLNTNQRDITVQKSCLCGSNTHLRRSHKDCPLNMKLIRNSQANQIQSIEDFADSIDRTICVQNLKTM